MEEDVTREPLLSIILVVLYLSPTYRLIDVVATRAGHLSGLDNFAFTQHGLLLKPG